MEESSKELIIKKIDELIDTVKKEKTYIRYKEIIKQMKSNDEIMSTIKELKSLNKQLINFEYQKKDTKELTEQILKKETYLNEFPIYNEYKYLQEDLDNLFQSIKYILEKNINDKLN